MTISRFGMSFEEHKKMVAEARERFKKHDEEDADEVAFIHILRILGFTDREIEAEIDLIRKGF